MPEIINASIEDINEIARCHRSSFPRSLSAALGQKYVSKMLSWYLSNDNTFLFFVKADGRCVGYFGGMVKTIWGVGSASSMAQYSFNAAVKSFLIRPWLVFHTEVRMKFPFILNNLKNRFLTKKGNDAKPKIVFEPYVGLVVIGVDPKFQGKGYGSLLLQAFEKKTIELGYRKMVLTVISDNAKAINSYERNGWKITKVNGKSTSMEKTI